jgi:hypothetical protein
MVFLSSGGRLRSETSDGGALGCLFGIFSGRGMAVAKCCDGVLRYVGCSDGLNQSWQLVLRSACVLAIVSVLPRSLEWVSAAEMSLLSVCVVSVRSTHKFCR